jgi:hypothetical protein
VIWQGMRDILIQNVFLSMKVETEVGEYSGNEFGIGVMNSGIIMAIVF